MIHSNNCFSFKKYLSEIICFIQSKRLQFNQTIVSHLNMNIFKRNIFLYTSSSSFFPARLSPLHGLGALLLESWKSRFQHQQDVWIRHHIATSVRVRCFVKDTSILCLVKPGIEPTTFRLLANPLYHLSYCLHTIYNIY